MASTFEFKVMFTHDIDGWYKEDARRHLAEVLKAGIDTETDILGDIDPNGDYDYPDVWVTKK